MKQVLALTLDNISSMTGALSFTLIKGSYEDKIKPHL